MSKEFGCRVKHICLVWINGDCENTNYNKCRKFWCAINENYFPCAWNMYDTIKEADKNCKPSQCLKILKEQITKDKCCEACPLGDYLICDKTKCLLL